MTRRTLAFLFLVAACGGTAQHVTTDTPTASHACRTVVRPASDYQLTSTLTLHDRTGTATYVNHGKRPFTYTHSGTVIAVPVTHGRTDANPVSEDRAISAGTIRPGETVVIDVTVAVRGCDGRELGAGNFEAVLFHDDVAVGSSVATRR